MSGLRGWSASQQVGLLFVVLFGLLLAVTAATALRSARESGPAPTEGQRRRRQRFKAELGAVWVGASLFWLAWIMGPGGSALLFAVVSFLALREYITLVDTRRGDHRSLILAFFIVLPLQYLIVTAERAHLFTMFIPVYVFFALPVVSALAGDPHRFLERNAKIQWGLMVCVYGLSHAPALLALAPGGAEADARGAFLLFFLVMCTVLGQWVLHAASLRLLGAKALAHGIDRRMSWRAWALAALAGGALGAALAWITPFNLFQSFVLGVAAAAAGTLGELVMRALKRDAGVRSWRGAASVTGAVGLLDRVAPMCFAAPVFFHLLRWWAPRMAAA